MFLGLLCLSSFPIFSAIGLYQYEITLTFDWSKSVYYQGDSGSVTISLESTCDNELEFTWIGIHFAWMREGYYYYIDLESDPISIPSHSSVTFDPLYFSVSSEALVGWNEYHILIICDEHHWYGWTEHRWESSNYQIYIHDSYEKTYNELKSTVLSNLNIAKNANYEAPDAKSYVTQAENEYSLAVSLANQDKWESAVNHLQTASNNLVQAVAGEEEYWRGRASEEIDAVEDKLLLLVNCESQGAISLRSTAESTLINAQNLFNQATISSYKNSYNYATQANAYTNQASIKEQEYQEEKQDALDIVNAAEQKINQIINPESTEAIQFLQQAESYISNAQIALDQKTIEGCLSAYSSAQESLNYANQSIDTELQFQEQKRQQQLIMIGGGVSIAAIVIIALAMRRRKKTTKSNEVTPD